MRRHDLGLVEDTEYRLHHDLCVLTFFSPVIYPGGHVDNPNILKT